MNLDWSHVIWEGRWEALVILWRAILIDVRTVWWFGPLLLVMIATAKRKKLLRFATYVGRVFFQTHS